MTGRTKAALAIVTIAISALVGIALAARPGYFLRESDNDAQVMWNDTEALVFIGSSQLGWSMNGLQLASEFANNIFGGVTPAEARRSSVTVVRYSPDGASKYLFNDEKISQYMVFEGRIYDSHARRWSGTHFEPIRQDEVDRFWRAMASYNPRVPHDGWSYNSALLHSADFERRISMWIGRKEVLLIAGHSEDGKWIDFQTAGQLPERVWQLDERRKHLSKEEYEGLFGR
jgi:hypothetical protein